MSKGETIDTIEVFTLRATLRFVDWDIPDHRDTQQIVPRYSLTVEDMNTGDKERFTGWGSIAQGERQEYSDATAAEYLAMVSRDALMVYDCGGELPDHGMIGITQLQDDYGHVVDCLSRELGIEEPSEAVRVFSGVMETAQKFARLNTGEGALQELQSYLVENEL